MNINEVKDLMHEFDGSSLREFAWNNGTDSLSFSKNTTQQTPIATTQVAVAPAKFDSPAPVSSDLTEVQPVPTKSVTEGDAVPSPLVGVVYTKSAPDKPEFVQVGDSVKKGQTLLIIEAMKVMNEIPAPRDGVITEILVTSDEVVEYGQELVRIK